MVTLFKLSILFCSSSSHLYIHPISDCWLYLSIIQISAVMDHMYEPMYPNFTLLNPILITVGICIWFPFFLKILSICDPILIIVGHLSGFHLLIISIYDSSLCADGLYIICIHDLKFAYFNPILIIVDMHAISNFWLHPFTVQFLF